MKIRNIIFYFNGSQQVVNSPIFYFVYGYSEGLDGLNNASTVEKNWIYSQLTQ